MFVKQWTESPLKRFREERGLDHFELAMVAARGVARGLHPLEGSVSTAVALCEAGLLSPDDRLVAMVWGALAEGGLGHIEQEHRQWWMAGTGQAADGSELAAADGPVVDTANAVDAADAADAAGTADTPDADDAEEPRQAAPPRTKRAAVAKA